MQTAPGSAFHPFSTCIDWGPVASVIRVVGELDMFTAPVLGTIVEAALARDHPTLVVDLTEVPFIDGAGLGVLADAAARLQATGGSVVVTGVSSSAYRLFEVAGMTGLIGPHPGPANSQRSGLPVFDGAPVIGPPADRDVVDAAFLLVVTVARTIMENADGVSVSLPWNGQLVTVAATDAETVALDRHQYAEGEGPCVAAAADGRQLRVDLVECETRWPAFASRVRHHEMRSILSTPIFGAGRPVGSINIYGNRADAFVARDEQLATVLADAAAGILACVGPDATRIQYDDRHRQALQVRMAIAQAQGVLMERHGVTADAAFLALLQRARQSQRFLRDEARSVTESAVHD